MRNWLITALAFCLAMLMMRNSLNALETNDSKWIDQLKSTPLSEMEPGLPNKPFGAWFDEHTKGADVHYRIEVCDGSANTESLKKGTFSCVTATAVRGIGSEIVMSFLVTADQQPGCKFIIGSEGPAPGSPMKRMTRVFRKLSEMITVMTRQ